MYPLIPTKEVESGGLTALRDDVDVDVAVVAVFMSSK